MKISDYLDFGKAENKYDTAIRMCCLIFSSAGFIVFIAVGLHYTAFNIWLLTFGCCSFGAAVCSAAAKMLINIIRKDRQKDKIVKADLLKRLLCVFIFIIAAAAFITIGTEQSEGDIKYWIIAFVGSFGGAVIASALVRMIFAFAGRDK